MGVAGVRGAMIELCCGLAWVGGRVCVWAHDVGGASVSSLM